MTAEEAKRKIADEFMGAYHEFLADIADAESIEFGKKYGFTMTSEGIKNHSKDTLKNLMWFQQRVFTGRYLPAWEKVGYDRKVIWQLNKEGWLAYQYYSNWNARATGRTDFYYIPQKTAREIYKASKA